MNPGDRISNLLKLVLLLVLIGCSAGAQPQNKEADISSPLNSPVARITGATNRGIVGDDATLVIRVEWTAQTLQPVTLLGFVASVEVEYSDGSKNTGSASVGGSARQADIRVLNKGSNAPRKFKARVESSFKFVDPNFATRTEEFTLNKSNGFESTGQGSPNARPAGELDIGRVRARFDGCGPGNDCFIVDWGAGPLASVTFTQFSIQGEVTYMTVEGDVVRTASATTPGNDRSTQLVVSEVAIAKVSKIVVKATVKASAAIQKNQTTDLTGSF